MTGKSGASLVEFADICYLTLNFWSCFVTQDWFTLKSEASLLKFGNICPLGGKSKVQLCKFRLFLAYSDALLKPGVGYAIFH